jgi:hypothetical protein
MKYRDLIQFSPITSVIKLVQSSDMDQAASLVKQYVFSQKIKENIREVVVRNLAVVPSGETFGIQIVGSYGTGKSHLMAVIAAIAENEYLLDHLQDNWIRKDFQQFAGQYKVLRFEIGTDKPLKDVVFAHLERFLKTLRIQFKFDESSSFSWKTQIQQMMAEFEEAFPNQHLLVVIDELLEYLKSRSLMELGNDLMMLRQLGEMCDHSRFKLMFGVQELLYRAPEFQHLADMMNKVVDRYSDLVITKEDVSFVVKERLLKKNKHQKSQIRRHLSDFTHLFEDMRNRFNEYVAMFPVHPRYIRHLERIKFGKSQREILKVLSFDFAEMIDTDVPTRAPGLITYDRYWKELCSSMNTIPDIRQVKDISEVIHDKIQKYFTGTLSNKKPAAIAIADALCLSILYDDLDKKNGAGVQSLCDDLCITLPEVNDAELLLVNVDTIAKQLVAATSGQYVGINDQTHEFYIRVEGDRNLDQDIKDYAEQVLARSAEQSDAFFFDFLQHIILINQKSCRQGYKIFEHSLNWLDKKSYRLGYIFFGNPNERSTTEPIQEYYIFFCPLFSMIAINDVSDEVYFDLSDLSDDFKNAIYLFGAAKALEGSAPSNQKAAFREKVNTLLNRSTALFETEYIEKTRVVYNGQTKPLKSFPLLAECSTKEQVFSGIAAHLLTPHFNDKYPHYPAFKELNHPISKDNTSPRIPAEVIKTLFEFLGLPDLTAELENSEAYIQIATKVKEMVDRIVKAKTLAASGIKCRDIALIPDEQIQAHQTALDRLLTTLDQIQPYNTIGKLKNLPFSSDQLKEIFSAYQLCPKIEQLHDLSQNISKLVTYLAQAISYLPTSEQPLYDDMQKAVNQLPEYLASGDKAEIGRYETALKFLIDRYADYYMSCYTRCRLFRESVLQKENILKSDNKRICDIVRDADFLSASEYTTWLNIVTSLTSGDEAVTKDRVKEYPYHDFNPKEHIGNPVYNMADLEERLQGILDKWINAMRAIFKDPSVTSNLDLLNTDDRALVENFRNGACDLTVANAPTLRDLISTLSRGIESVELTADTFKSIFSNPLTPSEAISALTERINSLCQGKERSKVRMIYLDRP